MGGCGSWFFFLQNLLCFVAFTALFEVLGSGLELMGSDSLSVEGYGSYTFTYIYI